MILIKGDSTGKSSLMLYWKMRTKPEKLKRPVDKLISKGVKTVHADCASLYLDNHQIKLENSHVNTSMRKYP